MRFARLVLFVAFADTAMLLAQQARQLMIWPVRGHRDMVAAANNFEVEAGYRMLVQGGNAIDAGVAAVLAAAVTEQARFGLGGEMPLIVKMAGKSPRVISGIGVAPAKATVAYYKARKAEPWEEAGNLAPIPFTGLHAVVTPGMFDGLMLALEDFGTMPLEKVAAPAIELASEGFPLGEEFAGFIQANLGILGLWPSSRQLFIPGGKAPARGDLWRGPALARTLQELVSVERKTRGNRGRKIHAVRDHFYRGPLGKRIAAYSESNGGPLTFDDLKKFQAEYDEPRTTEYRGYTIVKPGFWTQGPVMLQALNILEGYDLAAMGHNTPQYLHTVLEAVKLAFADRDRYYGDPKFSKIAEETLLSKSYAADRRKLIDPKRASMVHRPGAFGGPGAMPTGNGSSGGGHDTTCVNVADRWGNLFNATPSGAWLPSVIAGDTGIPFSSRLESFVMTEGHANMLRPGARPRVTLSPTMVLKGGKPFLIMSTPGGDNQDQAMLQVLLNIIEFGMIPQEAAEAPRFQSEHFYESFADHKFNPGKVGLEARIPRAVIDSLAGLGHRVEVRGDWSNGSAPTVILMRDGGVLDGGADPRRGRFIFGR
jgi:gamma-glutamyltranspeptidase/glutathione hydrolase